MPAVSALWFLHGLSIHFNLVAPPKDCDIILLAPHAPGVALREQYLGDRSLSAFYAVHQDYSRKARQTVFRLAEGLGFKRKRLVKTTFEQEALGDLFGEQAVLCGGLAALIRNGFETLTANGLPADHAYLEVAYQLDLIIALIKQYGIEGMLQRISVAARFGAIKTGPVLVDSKTRKKMQDVYNEIKSGTFIKALDKLSDSDIAKLKTKGKTLSHPDFEKAVRKFRK